MAGSNWYTEYYGGKASSSSSSSSSKSTTSSSSSSSSRSSSSSSSSNSGGSSEADEAAARAAEEARRKKVRNDELDILKTKISESRTNYGIDLSALNSNTGTLDTSSPIVAKLVEINTPWFGKNDIQEKYDDRVRDVNRNYL